MFNPVSLETNCLRSVTRISLCIRTQTHSYVLLRHRSSTPVHSPSPSFALGKRNLSFKNNLLNVKNINNLNPHKINLSCWKCQASIIPNGNEASPPSFPLKCPNCSRLQPQPPGTPLPNFYEILGLKTMKYEVDLPELSSAAKRLQRQLHPDLFRQREQIERDLSEKLSSLLNKAIRTFQDPIQRGVYLLELKKGSEVDLERQELLDPEFLGDVMELNERLDEVSTPEEWKDFRTENHDKLIGFEMELGSAFDKDDLEEAQLILNKMKFYESLQTRLKQLQFKFGVVD